MAITQIIATLPAVLNDSATFYEDIAERNNSLVTTVLPSINVLATQANTTQAEINAKAAQVAAQAVDGGYSQDYINSKPSGFKNYIINGKKVINQRALTLTDNSYNQDRWYKSGNNWYQGIEGNNNLISGKEYTLSWAGTATASYYVGTATSSTINVQSFTAILNGGNFTLTISADQNLWIKFASDASGSTFNFVQLEEGSIAAPFENRPYGLELSLCQRYYETGFIKSWGAATAAGQSMGHTQSYKVTKRVIPSITFVNMLLTNSTAIATETANQIETLITYTQSVASGTYAYQATFNASAEL